ncbi:hypothetical protein [Paenibacillus silvae]|uniref:hypothetical protein n=1 Tax=Paenibacillus silvae TaxID=1325358 RepID=UPI0020061415|nr:hypothetical protein [Paenibacillus silvae]MCK6076429.1 hypothetical protein [Paenibacillus silvae]MCK6150856.1 hypothetical protein [Paenibacillus silvae]MCK6269116.1 hypothetical protein [Paenibacillus silvae]
MRVLGIPLLGEQTYDPVAHMNVETARLLKPDLIIMDSEDKEQYEQLSRIAPTPAYNSHASLDERLT